MPIRFIPFGLSGGSPPSGGVSLKYWNGVAWVPKPLKYWNGAAWVNKPLKRWTGTAWE